MFKTTLLFLALFSFLSIQAQYDEWTPAKVVLTDGSSFRGLVKFPKHSGGLLSIGSTKFKYKKKRRSKTEKFGHETVDEIIFGDEDFVTVHYRYVPIKAQKFVLIELVIDGKASLFSKTVSKYQNNFFGDLSTNPSGSYYDDTQLFVFRENEKKVTLIAGPNSLESFISRTKKYFSDCSKIVSYLESNLYDLNNITELVDDYNLICD